MKKRLMSLLLSAAMIMSMIVVPASAAETPIELSVDVTSEAIAPGGTVDVAVSIADTDDEREYAGLKFKLLFDPAVLAPVDLDDSKKTVYAELGDVWAGSNFTQNYPKTVIDGMRYLAVNITNASGMYGTGVIATMQFQVVSDTLASEGALTLDVEKALYVQYNDDETTTDIDFAKNGELTVTNGAIAIKHPISVSTSDFVAEDQKSVSSVVLNGTCTNDGTVPANKVDTYIKWGYASDAMTETCEFGALIENVTKGATVYYQAFAAVDGGATYPGAVKHFTMEEARPDSVKFVEPTTSVSVPTAATTYTVAVLDQFKNPFETELTWDGSGHVSGVSFTTDKNVATLIVTKDALSNEDKSSPSSAIYTLSVWATADESKKDSVEITINRDASVVTSISAADASTEVPNKAAYEANNDVAAVTLVATGVDQYGDTIPVNVTWSIPSTKGVSIDASTGKLVVTNEAAAATIPVTATYNGNITTQCEVTITKEAPAATSIAFKDAAPSITVPTGDTPATGNFNAEVYDQYGEKMDATVNYAFTCEDSNITFDDETNTISVSKDAVINQEWKLTATVEGTTISTDVYVKIVNVVINGITTNSATYGTPWSQIVNTGSAKAFLDGNEITGGNFTVLESTVIPAAGTQTYRVQFVGGGHDVTYTGTVEIAPKPIDVYWTLTNHNADFSLDYTGKKADITADINASDLVPGDVVNVTVSGLETDVGSYKAEATLDNANYKLKDATASKNYTIVPAAIPNFNDATAKQISEGKLPNKVTASANVIALIKDEVKAYGFSNEELTGAITIDRDLSEYSAGSILTVYAVFTPDNTNFAPNTFSFHLEITEGDPQTVIIADSFNEATFTYGDAAFDLKQYIIVKRNEEVVAVPEFNFKSSDESVATVDVNSGEVTICSAGKVTINFTVAGDEDWAPYLTGKMDITVAPKAVTITGATAADKVYDGKTDAVISSTDTDYQITDLVVGDTVSVDATNAKAAFADANAGTGKTVTFTGFAITGEDAKNYTLSAQPADDTADITKTPAADITVKLNNATQAPGQSVTGVEVVTTPPVDPSAIEVKYQVVKTPAVDAKDEVPCDNLEGCVAGAHDANCKYAPAVEAKPAEYEWVSTVPTEAGTYPVQITIKENNNVEARTFESDDLKLTLAVYSGGGGGGAVSKPVAVEKAENGTISLSNKFAAQGKEVTITAKPDEGYELKSITVVDEKGNEIEVTEKNGKYAFKMPATKVTITPVFGLISEECASDKFVDLDTNAWYHEAVDFVIKNGMMNGVSANEFAPTMNLTRSMVVQILWAMDGKPVVNYAMSFDDVAAGAWYAEAVRWAASEGIVSGYSADVFGSDDSVTREQMAVMLCAYARYKGADMSVGENTNILSYNDAFSISEWAIPAMQWACGEGILSGKTGGYLDPAGTATRMEAAQMLMKFSAVLAD